VTFTINGSYSDANSDGSITLGTGSKWKIPGDLTLTSDADFKTVGSGSTLEIDGSLNIAGGNASMTIDGTLDVGTNIDMGSGSPAIGGSGDIFWAGSFSFGGGASISSGSCGGPFASNSSLGLADCGVVLPVRYAYISSGCLNESTQIKWATTLELNNETFIIQGSNDLENYAPIASIPGSGTLNTGNDYQLELSNNEYEYFRILQRDFDGEFEYSSVYTLAKCKSENELYVFPTISNGEVTINGLDADESATINIFNQFGKLVLSPKVNNSPLNISSLRSGNYFIQISRDSSNETFKIIKL
jgi:hypothetical protein